MHLKLDKPTGHAVQLPSMTHKGLPHGAATHSAHKLKGDYAMKHTWMVKGVKMFEGMEGRGFNASLYMDGKRVAKVRDDATGGELWFDWLDRSEGLVEIKARGWKGEMVTMKVTRFEAALEEEATALPSYDYHGMTMYPSAESIVNGLVDDYNEAQWLKRQMKRHTLFRIKGDDDGAWRTLDAPWSERMSAWIANEYGVEAIERIIKNAGDIDLYLKERKVA